MISTIATECSDFLTLSHGNPLLKLLPKDKDGFSKIKVRYKKKNKDSKYESIRSKAIFSYSSIVEKDNLEAFYIFPINGFKFMYCEMIKESSLEFKKNIERIVGRSASEVMDETFEFSYSDNDLSFGIANGSEIIIYGIPYYYAIRKSIIGNYSEFLI